MQLALGGDLGMVRELSRLSLELNVSCVSHMRCSSVYWDVHDLKWGSYFWVNCSCTQYPPGIIHYLVKDRGEIGRAHV